jgi:nucleoside phosphorylase
MIRILIADDNDHKIKKIREVIDNIPEIEEYDIAIDLVTAKKYLSTNHYDLLVLDLNMPNRIGDDPMPTNGANFLLELDRSSRLIKPAYIIGLSAYDNYIEDYQTKFDDHLWGLVKYDELSDSWSNKLVKKINYLIQSKRDLSVNINGKYQFDLAIITALRVPELQSILNLQADWSSFKLNNDATEYHKGIFKKGEKKITVVAASTSQMGMVASSLLTHKLIVNFRPKQVAMTGIAGGVNGISNYGDILAADISFDSGSGKIRTDKNGVAKFEPDYKSINLQTDIKEALQESKANRDFLDSIKKLWSSDSPDTELNIHIGPLASGAGVIENRKVIDEIKGHSRKLIGIDMETYGVFYSAINCSKPRPYSVLSLKSVSDFADPEKNDNYQNYAAFTSANYLYNFALEKMNFD